MVNVLIFRTDRIGDLIVTCPTIITIKKHFKEINVSIVASSKNFDYARNLGIFDIVYKFSKNNIFSKITLIYKLHKKKFDYIFIFDGKNRSIWTASFVKSNFKVALSREERIFHKFLNMKFFKDDENTNLNEIFQKMLDFCNIDTKIKNYDFITNKKDNNFSENIPINKYIHIHLDEKWFNDLYIKSYTNINPKYVEFVQLINDISEKRDILITTGVIDTKLVNDLKKNFFLKIDDKIFYKKNLNKSIYLIYKPTFDDIESLLRKSNILIACHGSITHAANSFDIRKIDILEEGMISFYNRFTSYLKKHYPIYRSNFENLKEEIYNKVLTI